MVSKICCVDVGSVSSNNGIKNLCFYCAITTVFILFVVLGCSAGFDTIRVFMLIRVFGLLGKSRFRINNGQSQLPKSGHKRYSVYSGYSVNLSFG